MLYSLQGVKEKIKCTEFVILWTVWPAGKSPQTCIKNCSPNFQAQFGNFFLSTSQGQIHLQNVSGSLYLESDAFYEDLIVLGATHIGDTQKFPNPPKMTVKLYVCDGLKATYKVNNIYLRSVSLK